MRALGLVGYGEIAEGQAGELDQVDPVLEVLDGVDAFAEPEDEGWGEQGRDADLAEADVFARASPRDKLRIVQAFQNAGRVVAMTGDGINDGPALRAADVAITFGESGTEVARSVGDMILLRDDLGGIVEATALGRATDANIRKSVCAGFWRVAVCKR